MSSLQSWHTRTPPCPRGCKQYTEGVHLGLACFQAGSGGVWVVVGGGGGRVGNMVKDRPLHTMHLGTLKPAIWDLEQSTESLARRRQRPPK